MFAILSFHASNPARPYRVTGPDRTRTYKTFSAASAAARAVFSEPTADRWPTAAELTGPYCGNPLEAIADRTADRPDPDPASVDNPRRVYRITGKRGRATVQRDITARGHGPAVRAFCERTAADTVERVRVLSRRDPDAKSARVRKTTADRSSKIRRQRNAAERGIAARADRR
jgi:hypothetical protein